jgi:2,4-dienoyl-CoA reductase-like NADH-dependent reductase (Old Yellow Enzyme family)
VVQPVQKEPGCLVHLAEAFKRELNIPVIAVGRINEPSLAEKILEEKKADLIAMGRALIADPYLLRKVQEGKANEINKCLADNQCINTLFQRGREITCSVNGDLGTEKELHFR